jgi:hypothetical protein
LEFADTPGLWAVHLGGGRGSSPAQSALPLRGLAGDWAHHDRVLPPRMRGREHQSQPEGCLLRSRDLPEVLTVTRN